MEHPSIVLITVDCLRAGHLGCYGYDRNTTPRIDRFAARDDVTVYENAYACGPGTRWAFQAMFLGEHPLRFRGIGMPASHGTCAAETLRDLGYAGSAFVNNGFLTKEFHYDRGFAEFRDVEYWTRKTGRKALLRKFCTLLRNRFLRGLSWTLYHETDAFLVDEVLDLLHRREGEGAPFFLWVHLMDAHTPYVLAGNPEGSEVRDPHLVEDVDRRIASYDAAVRSVDVQVGRLLAQLPETASVVLTADHGEEFGRHTRFHRSSLYEGFVRIPLLIRNRAFDGNARTQTPVTHLDLHRTLLGLGGAPADDAGGIDLSDRDAVATRGDEHPVFLGFERDEGITVGLVEGDLKLIWRTYEDRFELYDFRKDPDEAMDLYVGEGSSPRVRKMEDGLRFRLAEVTGSRLATGRDLYGPNMKIASKNVENKLRELGYI
jgi:arylsulfatase A-like enzyme